MRSLRGNPAVSNIDFPGSRLYTAVLVLNSQNISESTLETHLSAKRSRS
jgi:hypothetical protein